MKNKLAIRFECSLCHIYVDLPLEQFKKRSGGLFLDNLKCINCQSSLEKDLKYD